ncbi:unnamed protein product, partial [Rotaria sordida]
MATAGYTRPQNH